MAAARPSGRRSAGLLVYRRQGAEIEVLLVHPGGPFWRRRDDGAWSIPKGLVEPGEDDLAAARREFAEEVGMVVEGGFVPLAPVRQKGGKRVLCWMVEADLDLSDSCSATFEMEWPPRSGRLARFPECDRAAYWAMDLAAAKILPSQRAFLDEAAARLGAAGVRSAGGAG